MLVSNNPYEASDLAGMGRRARLDRGTLGVIAVQVGTARQAVGLLNGAHQRGLLLTQARDVLVSSDEPTVPVGIDGESVHLSTPVRCTVRPGALRVRLPRERPGVRPPQGRLDLGVAVGAGPRPADVGASCRGDRDPVTLAERAAPRVPRGPRNGRALEPAGP